MTLQIATCSYTGYQREMGMPVRISRSAPRWAKLPSERFGTFTRWAAVAGLMPDKVYADAPDDEFARRFNGQMDDLADSILTELTALHGLYGPLVLCCFEKDLTDPYACHRTLAARWLEGRLGIEVPELGDGK
jgi:hypothetical protein